MDQINFIQDLNNFNPFNCYIRHNLQHYLRQSVFGRNKNRENCKQTCKM
jgi:hypothetical protein